MKHSIQIKIYRDYCLRVRSSFGLGLLRTRSDCGVHFVLKGHHLNIVNCEIYRQKKKWDIQLVPIELEMLLTSCLELMRAHNGLGGCRP